MLRTALLVAATVAALAVPASAAVYDCPSGDTGFSVAGRHVCTDAWPFHDREDCPPLSAVHLCEPVADCPDGYLGYEVFDYTICSNLTRVLFPGDVR